MGSTVTLIVPEKIGRCTLVPIPTMRRTRLAHGRRRRMNRVILPRRIVGPVPRARVQIACAPAPHLRRAGHALPLRVSCDTFSDDILATIDCLNAMGAKITHDGRNHFRLTHFRKRETGRCLPIIL